MFELTNRTKKKLKNLFNTTVAVTSSFSIVLSSVSYSYAQSIIVDPSAAGTSFLQTSNLTPQINIANPQSGVSLNQFSEFNVGSEGLILNNSTTGGVSIIGENVTANANLVSGPATVIVNEVISAAPSSLTGTTEVFGQQAAVIIANPNGILCNGCNFLNTTSSSLTTGVPTISAGGDVSLTVEKGTITIGTSGFTSENNLGLYGRHVIINGEVKTLNQDAVNTAIVSGGGQSVMFGATTPDQGDVTAHITTETITSPFAIDASEAGRISSGNVTILGNEAGQSVNIYGDVTISGTLNASSGGDLFYKNITTGGDAIFSAVNGGIRQYGDLNADGTVTIAGNSFTLYDGRIIQTTGDITINTAEYLVIAGEVSGGSIAIDISNGTLTNTGFILSDNDLTIVAGDGVSQQRNVASEYDIYFDPALQQYLQAYQTQLLEGGEEADIAAEMIARAELHDLIAEYIDQGATISGTNVTITAGNDITNTGGAIAATNDILLTAGNQIINEFLALRSRLNAEDGCPDETCGYRTDFHAGEILAGNDLTLTTTTGNIENRASDIAAANNILLNAGQDVVNTLMASNYEAFDTETVQFIGPGLVTTSCGKDCEVYSVVQSEYTTSEYRFDEENILSPGRIATLYGNVAINTGRDFISIGSEISAGNDLTITATGQAIMSSFVDAEEDFINRNERYAGTGCSTGKNAGYCTGNQGFLIITYDDTTLATATSNLVGRSISVTAGDNITLLGARFLAAVDLDLTSTNGSVLIDSTDLPEEIELGNSDGVQFVELRDDVIAQIFGTSDFAGEIAGLGAFYTNLITDPVVATATQDRVVNSAVEIILAEVVQTWQAGYDPANPTAISASLTSLQTDDVRRATLAENLLYIIANELGDEADVLGDAAYTSLDEYRLLQTLILNGASDDALNTAALSLVDALASDLLANTLALEAVAVAPATLPELTVEYLELRETTIFDQVFAELVTATPTEVTQTTITAYEALSIEDAFMQNLAVALANAVAVDLGRDPLFVADGNGEYNTDGALLDFESDASLQRLVLEVSLILSPGSAEPIPTSAELSTLVTGGTSTKINILKIIDELADLSPLITNAVVKLIEARDLEAKSDAVLAQDASGLTVDVASLVDTVASSLGTQALTERQAEVDTNTSQYVQFLQGNELLTAVEGLRRATSGADIKDAAHNVGVQSYVSLIDSDHLDALRADASASIAALHATIGADIIAHNNTVSSYNAGIRAQLKTLTDLLELSSTELTAEIQSQLDAITVAYDTQVITIEADYQSQLAANEAEYGDLLTTQVWRSYQTGGKDSVTKWRWVTVTNTYYVDLKNTVDAQAETDRVAALDSAGTQNQIDVALVQLSSTDAGINSQIATISTGFTTQLDSFAVEKTVLFASLTTQVAEAMRVAELVTQQKVLEESIRTTALAKDSVVEGERSLAAALTKDAFPELNRVKNLSLNDGGIIENTRDGTEEATRIVTEARDVGEYQEQVTIISVPHTTAGYWDGKNEDVWRAGTTTYTDQEVVENVWVVTGTEDYQVEETYIIQVTNPLISTTKEEQDAFINATAWRFASASALATTPTSAKNLILSQGDLTLYSQGDILLNDTDLIATNKIGLSSFGNIGARRTALKGNVVGAVAAGSFTGIGLGIDAQTDVSIFAGEAVDIKSLGTEYSFTDTDQNIVGTLSDKVYSVNGVGIESLGFAAGHTVTSQELSSIRPDSQ